MAVRMFLRTLVYALAFCMVAQPAVYAQQEAPAQSQETAAPQSSAAQSDTSAAIKAELQHIGKGNQAIATFGDGTTHAGRIRKLNSDSFSLDEGHQGTGSYNYADVSSVNVPQHSNAGSKVVTVAFLATGLIVVAGMVGFAVTKGRTGSAATAASPAK